MNSLRRITGLWGYERALRAIPILRMSKILISDVGIVAFERVELFKRETVYSTECRRDEQQMGE